jgi:hypothetical protein
MQSTEGFVQDGGDSSPAANSTGPAAPWFTA